MTATILQVSVSKGGVPKHSIPLGILTPTGLEGDRQAHPDIHGGPQQAVLLITAEGIAELAAQGFPLTARFVRREPNHQRHPAVKNGASDNAGKSAPEAVIEITKRRAPCQTLNVYGPGLQAAIYDSLTAAGDPSSPKWGLSGFYASVVRPGIIQPGDEIVLAP